jgi:hypothetical protein
MGMRKTNGIPWSCRPERELFGRDRSIGLASNIDYIATFVLSIMSQGLS